MRLFERFRAARVERANPAPRRPPTAPATGRPEPVWTRQAAPHAVEATWLQLPTLRCAGWLVDVVGESFYQDAIEEAGGGRSEDGAVIPLVTAQLVLEPENPYDANAVRVEIGGKPCGHIPADEAADYHGVIAALNEIGRPATCRAWIIGGWEREGGDVGRFGVRLDLNEDLGPSERGAIMPFSEIRVSITGEQHHQDHLAALLGGADRVEVMAVLGAPAERVEVWVNAVCVGALTPKMSERYGPWIREVQAAMLPSSCAARIIRGEKKIEVFLKLAKPGGRH